MLNRRQSSDHPHASCVAFFTLERAVPGAPSRRGRAHRGRWGAISLAFGNNLSVLLIEHPTARLIERVGDALA